MGHGSLNSLIIFDLANPWIIIKESNFEGIHLRIQSKRHFFDPVLFSLLLERSCFTRSIHVGEGGALAINSEVHNSQVTISDCLFTENSAVNGIGHLKGQGGGLYIKGNSLNLEMTNVMFKGNKASDSGLAMYTTDGVDVSIKNSTFQYVIIDSPTQQPIMFVTGKISKFHGVFGVINPDRNAYFGPIDVFYIGQGAELFINIHCPKFYNHYVEHMPMSLSSQDISGVLYMCNPCNNNYYTAGIENKFLVFNGNETMVYKELAVKKACLPCPYGALCTGTDVLPRPNYWGYWHKGELVFHQCPAGYCCPRSDNSTCKVYNYCLGNRTGALCGVCKEGFSFSILTVACMPNNQCGSNQWLWVVIILATAAYAWWYTLKDDIFGMFFSSITCINNMVSRLKANTNNLEIELKSFSRKQSSVIDAIEEN